MGYRLLLEVPDNLYESLVSAAKRLGESPQEVAVYYLAAAIERFGDDPLEQFIGAFDSRGLKWADQHDAYLGLTLLAEASAPYEAGNSDG